LIELISKAAIGLVLIILPPVMDMEPTLALPPIVFVSSIIVGLYLILSDLRTLPPVTKPAMKAKFERVSDDDIIIKKLE
jgi:hypothetical protein